MEGNEAAGLDPELDRLDETTLAVRDLIAASQDLSAHMARRMGTNVRDMTAVMMLAERGPVGSAELARWLGISAAAATMLVDRLERAGHVERIRDTVDRRRVIISETPAARAATLAAWRPAIHEMDQVALSLSADERVVARKVLADLTAAMARGAGS